MASSADDLSQHPLWPQAEAELIRAERLLQRSLLQLESEGGRQQQQRARIGLELERILAPLQRLSAGLGGLIEAMAADRQDNRSQRWQGQLQELLLPLDAACLQLQELLVQLDQPAQVPAANGEGAGGREAVQRLQLQQLLALRQRQVLQQQAELAELRRQLFAQAPPLAEASDDSNAAAAAEAPGPGLPSIFGSEA
jgi:hypothetical protein